MNSLKITQVIYFLVNVVAFFLLKYHNRLDDYFTIFIVSSVAFIVILQYIVLDKLDRILSNKTR